MAALCARIATAGRASLTRVRSSSAPLAAPARPCRRRDVATAAMTTADFDALSHADGGGEGGGGLAAAALRLAAAVLGGIPASVALDEVADREGQRVRALTNAQTAEGVRLYVAHPASVHAGEPAPVVILIHQARRVRQRNIAAQCSAARGRAARLRLREPARRPFAESPTVPFRGASGFWRMSARAKPLSAHPPADALRCAVLRAARARNRAVRRAGEAGAL